MLRNMTTVLMFVHWCYWLHNSSFIYAFFNLLSVTRSAKQDSVLFTQALLLTEVVQL